MTRVRLGAGILGFVIGTLLLRPAAGRAEYATYLVDLTGDGVIPPVETAGTGHIEARWASGFTQPWPTDTLIVEIDLDRLEGTPQELRVHSRPDEGEDTILTTVLQGGVETGRHEIPIGELEDGISPVGPNLWFVLTTTVHLTGEIAGPLRQEFHFQSCGLVYPDDECPEFLDYETWDIWTLDWEVPYQEPTRAYVLGEVVHDSECDDYRNRLRVLSGEACESKDLGGGRYYVDEYDGCNVWRSPLLGKFRTTIFAGDGDSVQVWGVRLSGNGDVCAYGLEMIDVDSAFVFPDTLTPIRSTSWGDLKRILGR